MTTLNDITVRALKMHKADGIRYIAKALQDEQERTNTPTNRPAPSPDARTVPKG